MNNSTELNWNELKRLYQPSDFSFQTTNEVIACEEIIGQEKTLEAIKKALQVEAKGFNLYICGADSDEKERAIIKVIEELAREKQTPDAIGYIYNFEVPDIPKLIQMKAQHAKALKDDLEEMVAFIVNELPLKLQDEELEKKRETLMETFEEYKEEQLTLLYEEAESLGMAVKISNEGLYFIPLDKNGEVVSKSEYTAYSLKEKEEIQEKLNELYALADKIDSIISKEEEKYIQVFQDINQEIILQEIGILVKKLIQKYEAYPQLQRYFNTMAEDLLGHLELFTPNEEQKDNYKEILPWLNGNSIEKLVKKYGINLLTHYEEGVGAPVIVDYDWPHMNMLGRLLFETELNMIYSDFSHIRPGLLHQANGGYLILHMQQLAEQPGNWLALKKVLKTGMIRIEGNEELGVALTHPIKPQPLKANLKVILLGNEELYQLLYEKDEDFKKLFKMQVTFANELDSDVPTIEKLAGFIKGICQKEHLPHVTIEGILKLVDYGNRQMSTAKKLPGTIEELIDLLREACIYATDKIDAQCIEKAIKQRFNQYAKVQDKIDERIKDEIYLINTEGRRVGQVNGLAVYQILDFSFGRPIKITATTYKGKQGIVNIEKEADLSGSLHTKGVHIITGFLGDTFAQDMPLSLSCNICFEQSYGTVDGDSASSAELYCILSSLSGLPIKQCLATTGSMNQFGEIQPIGGVNEKIEGFFKVCQQRGLKGDEGVIIPYQNVKDLLLKEEVLEAVKNKSFHIYPIVHIWEGMQLMTDTPKEEIIRCIKNKLKRFNE